MDLSKASVSRASNNSKSEFSNYRRILFKQYNFDTAGHESDTSTEQNSIIEHTNVREKKVYG